MKEDLVRWIQISFAFSVTLSAIYLLLSLSTGNDLGPALKVFAYISGVGGLLAALAVILLVLFFYRRNHKPAN